MPRLPRVRVLHRPKHSRRSPTATMMTKNESNPSEECRKINNQMEIDRGTGIVDRGRTSFFKVFFSHEELGTDLQEAWPMVKLALTMRGISCRFNPAEGSMTVSKTSTSKSRNPSTTLVKAKGVLELLASGVPASKAMKLMKQGMEYEIIKLGNQADGFCSKFGVTEKQFLRRIKYLDQGQLDAISEFTGSHIVHHGDTVAAMSKSSQALEIVRRVLEFLIVRKYLPTYTMRTFVKVRAQVGMMRELNSLRI